MGSAINLHSAVPHANNRTVHASMCALYMFSMSYLLPVYVYTVDFVNLCRWM